MHTHTFPSDTHTGHEPPAAQLPKDRATRRAAGQRGRRYRVGYRSDDRRENGAQRAAWRAELHGLTVGAPVRILLPGAGLRRATVAPHPYAVPHSQRVYAGPGGATPLDYAQRLGRYWAQRAAVTHIVPPPGWRATPRQLRRLRHKANHAAAPFKRPLSPRETNLERVTNLATGDQRTEVLAAPVTPEQFVRGYEVEPRQSGNAERERSAINRNGYRVVDRRREHH